MVARGLLAETLRALLLAISREARVRWRTPARTRTQSRWGRRRLSAPPRLRPAHNLARPWPGALDGRSAMRLHRPGRVVGRAVGVDESRNTGEDEGFCWSSRFRKSSPTTTSDPATSAELCEPYDRRVSTKARARLRAASLQMLPQEPDVDPA